MKLPLSIIDGHLFVQIASQYYLIDTGSVKSFSKQPSLQIGDLEVSDLPDNFLGVNCEMLDKYINCTSSGLLGADFLSRFCLGISMREGWISFEQAAFAETSVASLSIRLFQNLVLTDFSMNGKEYPLFVDTGAPQSYIKKGIASGDVLKSISDFHPFAGEFEADAYLFKLAFLKEEFDWSFAEMPEVLERGVVQSGGLGIMGLDLFKTHDVFIDYPSRLLFLKP